MDSIKDLIITNLRKLINMDTKLFKLLKVVFIAITIFIVLLAPIKSHAYQVYSDNQQKIVMIDTNYKSLIDRAKVMGKAVIRTKFEVTMYTNAEGYWEPGDTNWGTMANGQKTHHGVVAAPKSIPFGANIIFDNINGDWSKMNRVHIVADRGGAITEKWVNGNKIYCIDVWTDDLNEALQWGRRVVEGWIIY